MGKARKKPEAAGEKSPVVSHAVPPGKGTAQRYRFNQAHNHANVAYVAGDTVTLTEEAAARIRHFAGADAITHVPE